MKLVISHNQVKASTHNKEGLRTICSIHSGVDIDGLKKGLKKLNAENHQHFLKTGLGMQHSEIDSKAKELRNTLATEIGK